MAVVGGGVAVGVLVVVLVVGEVMPMPMLVVGPRPWPPPPPPPFYPYPRRAPWISTQSDTHRPAPVGKGYRSSCRWGRGDGGSRREGRHLVGLARCHHPGTPIQALTPTRTHTRPIPFTSSSPLVISTSVVASCSVVASRGPPIASKVLPVLVGCSCPDQTRPDQTSSVQPRPDQTSSCRPSGRRRGRRQPTQPTILSPLTARDRP